MPKAKVAPGEVTSTFTASPSWVKIHDKIYIRLYVLFKPNLSNQATRLINIVIL